MRKKKPLGVRLSKQRIVFRLSLLGATLDDLRRCVWISEGELSSLLADRWRLCPMHLAKKIAHALGCRVEAVSVTGGKA